MEKINDGGPAFPSPDRPIYYTDESHDQRLIKMDSLQGMSLRDYIATHALAGSLANADCVGSLERLSVSSYAIADAMLKAREAKP